MRIFLCIGQSNMAGRGAMGEFPCIRNERVLMLRQDRWVTAKEPVNPDRVYAGESLQLPFADIVQRATGDTVGLVPCAVGGTLLAQWAPGGELFENAVSCARTAQKTDALSGILWIQGENDGYSRENAALYTSRLLAMLDALKSALGAGAEVPVILAQLCPFLDVFNARVPSEQKVPYFADISRQLAALPSLRRDIYCVKTDGLSGKPDGIHYDTRSLRILGARFAQAYLRIIHHPQANAAEEDNT